VGLDNPLHIAFLLIVVLLVFGARRLPEMGRSLGSGLRGFRDALGDDAPRAALVADAHDAPRATLVADAHDAPRAALVADAHDAPRAALVADAHDAPRPAFVADAQRAECEPSGGVR
jgi:sec-independent protein translocase protein TatA